MMESAPPAGTRFTVNLDDHADDEIQAHQQTQSTSSGLITDILERSSTSAPVAPTLSTTSNTGFPAHTKRSGPSRFKQRIAAKQDVNAKPVTKPPASSRSQETNNTPRTEKETIEAENNDRLAHMSEDEIAQERRELVDNLSPELLQMFLRRATLDDVVETSRPEHRDKLKAQQQQQQQPSVEAVNDETAGTPTHAKPLQKDPSKPSKSVTFADLPEHLKDIPPEAFPDAIKIHFPSPHNSSISDPDPDPSSPAFLNHLHQKYFPNLPADLSKLAWMQPPKATDPDSYNPNLPSLVPSALRFDFGGRLLPPRTAREMPAHLGLHHHADAPMSAGYTVPELAHLSRSSFPAQRCMAIQTLGRILYKLGIGEYSGRAEIGKENGGGGGGGGGGGEEKMGNEDVGRGLWRCLHEGRVIDTLQEAATGGKRGDGDPHLGVRSYAVEALWLWQKGGGETWKAD